MITWSKGMESSGLWIDPFLESVVFPEQFLSQKFTEYEKLPQKF